MNRRSSNAISMNMLWLVLPLLWSSALAEKDQAAGPGTSSNAGLQISLQRSTIREDDRIPVHIVVSNPSDKPLTNVSLNWSIPSSFLTLYPVSCVSLAVAAQTASSKKPASVFQIPELPGNTNAQSIQAYDFCLVSTSAGEDTFDLFFALHYAWSDKAGSHYSLLTQEKSIRSAFLGSDTLAGVPLGLASLVIPGLLFWMILDFWRTPWRLTGSALGDKMIYSVLVSLLLIAVLAPWNFLRPYLDLTSGLSMRKLVLLATIGAACGLLVGGLDRWIRGYLTDRAPNPSDSDLVLFAKLLRINRGKLRQNSIVFLKENISYRGSVGAVTATHVFLMGWYHIEGVTEETLKKSLQDLISRGRYVKALKIASEKGLDVTARDFLYSREGNSDESQELTLVRMVETTDHMKGPLLTTNKDASRPLELS